MGTHLLVIDLVALALFRRHDLATLYAFRAFYYLHWHIVWGYLRLQILFGGWGNAWLRGTWPGG